MDTRIATLEYLTNPSYQNNLATSGITRQPIIRETISTADKRFYKKRLFNLFKEILKGKTCPEDIKESHEEFIHGAIHYFKLVDKRDILQQEHDINEKLSREKMPDQVHSSNIKDYEESQGILSSANKEIMREKKTESNLDTFVKKKKISSAPPLKIPSQKAINLKDPTLKNKGIKNKKLKN